MHLKKNKFSTQNEDFATRQTTAKMVYCQNDCSTRNVKSGSSQKE